MIQSLYDAGLESIQLRGPNRGVGRFVDPAPHDLPTQATTRREAVAEQLGKGEVQAQPCVATPEWCTPVAKA